MASLPAFQANAFQGNAFQIGPLGAGPVDTSLYGWRQPLTEPVRTKVLSAALVAASFTIGTPPAVAPISWLQPFSEPVRSRSRLPTPEQRFFEPSPQPITPSTDWVVELSKPTPRRSLGTWLQQASAWTPITIINPDLGHIGWYANLSEPVRTRPALRTAAQPFAVGSLQPFVSFSWNEARTELPPRVKPGLLVHQQMVATMPPRILVSFSWWEPTAELPPRAKSGLGAHQQQAFTKSTFTPLPTWGWEQARTELPPGRLRGLDAWRQQSTAWTPINIGVVPDITGVWASTETKDRFLASGTMFEAPFEAIAGVIEKRLTDGLSGVVEDPLPGAIVSTNVSIRTI